VPLDFSQCLLDQSADLSIGKTGGDNTHPRFSPCEGQPLDRPDDDRDQLVGADAPAQQPGSHFGDGCLDDVGASHRL
jgi:hypothetical protein